MPLLLHRYVGNPVLSFLGRFLFHAQWETLALGRVELPILH
jgi:hypothetical protein